MLARELPLADQIVMLLEARGASGLLSVQVARYIGTDNKRAGKIFAVSGSAGAGVLALHAMSSSFSPGIGLIRYLTLDTGWTITRCNVHRLIEDQIGT